MLFPAVLAGLSLASPLLGQTYTITGTDHTTYLADSNNNLFVTTNPSDLQAALVGNATNAGGNVELFASSDLAINDSPAQGGNFANASRTILSADFGSNGIVSFSSLNGQDWFNDSSGSYDLAFGANNLANQWFADFVTELMTQPTLVSFISGNEQALFESFRDNGGFAQLSDANISYVEETNGTVTAGLGGFIDSSPRIVGLVSDATGLNSSLLSSLIPAGLQFSEVVLIDGEANYAFSATDSGVILQDGLDSYSGNFEITLSTSVPEPSSALLLGLSSSLWMVRRKR